MTTPTKFRRFLNRFALSALRVFRVVIRRCAVVLKPTGKVLGFIFGLAIRFVFFPLYSLLVMLKIRLSRLLVSARGFFFLVFTNRYVFHVALLVVSIITISTQLGTRTATAVETGRHSVLYALVTDGRDDVVTEAAHPEALAKNANYLGSSTIQALPGVDYDYETQGPSLAQTNVPGTIAAEPGSEIPGIPGKPVVATRTATETYVVQDGDTVGSIAAQYGVNVGTVIWANKLSSRGSIKPGDALKVPPVSGVLHVVKRGDTIAKIAFVYGADAEQIYQANRLMPDATLSVGQELVVPGGTPPAPVVPAKPKIALQPGVPITKIADKSYDQYQEIQATPPDNRVKPPDETAAVVPEGKLLWPTDQHVINQYYGWRHTGIDFNGDYTDPIYAADDGVVERAGWNASGYGLMIQLNHGGGIQTRYGHSSKIFVNAGDTVKRGEVIGMVGTTGRSTGTHLHFEVIINGTRVNPLAYIK